MPPLSVPLRFFLTAPVFALLAAVVIATAGPAAAVSRWMPPVLAATHLMTLGFVTMTSAGALLQILPVAAGAPVAHPRLVAGLVHVALAVGAMLLALAFLSGAPLLKSIAAAVLLAGIGIHLVAVAQAIARAPVATPLGVTVGFSLTSLTVALLIGVTLAVLPFSFDPALHTLLVDLHLAWGLAGWIALLVAGIAYQVIPMFRLTRPYPALMHRVLAPAVVGALALMSAAAFAGDSAVGRFFYRLAGAGILSVFGAFAAVTWRIQAGGHRNSATDSAWRLAILALAVSLLVAGASLTYDTTAAYPIALTAVVVFLFGFAFWMIAGMLYRVVPFLAWMDLQRAAGHIRPLPSAGQLALQRSYSAHVWAHAAALALLVAAANRPTLATAAGVGIGISALWLELNLLLSLHRYRAAKRDLSRRTGASGQTRQRPSSRRKPA